MTDDAETLAQHILDVVKDCKPLIRDEALARVVATCMRDYDKPGMALGIFLDRAKTAMKEDSH